MSNSSSLDLQNFLPKLLCDPENKYDPKKHLRQMSLFQIKLNFLKFLTYI